MFETFIVLSVASKTVGLVMAVVSGIGGSLWLLWRRWPDMKIIRRRIKDETV